MEGLSTKRLDFARFYESLLTDKLSISYKRQSHYFFKEYSYMFNLLLI